ncbi:hypothetical protein VNO77_01932 [Canavalia gladiata]|uniref:Uncharacterized protein n=1 Tax=Canavalia gladiata TaxID=3824 RepID=A0AAN9MYH8_CANGL
MLNLISSHLIPYPKIVSSSSTHWWKSVLIHHHSPTPLHSFPHFPFLISSHFPLPSHNASPWLRRGYNNDTCINSVTVT